MSNKKWKVSTNNNCWINIENEKKQIVAEAKCYGVGWPTEDEAIENAKLISAAPELLEACQSFVSDFEGDFMMSDGTIVDNPSNLLLVNYKIAKKAIAKAVSYA